MSESPSSNLQELSVSELSQALKRTIETTYDRVRVRGELGRVTIARSGHMYADIKDEKAVLNTVMWKGQVNRLPFRPEEGLEVIATGRLSTYPGRSNYQLIADDMRPAGVGALMALLEERKKKLAAEGLFDPKHKQQLPFLPRRIGVVTSPTGAVIRDILHRISDRFPCEVVLWPALVQGDNAAPQIVAGITGFNAMLPDQRPDVLIVGRGGGSIEDLWPFNEEAVVRAAFNSQIPLISAVGHETDTTLIDYVSDARAPTPTGAAEIAVPVRSELQLQIDDYAMRKKQAILRLSQRGRERLLASRLPSPERLLGLQRQRFDMLNTQLPKALLFGLERLKTRVSRLALEPYNPRRKVQDLAIKLKQFEHGLSASLRHTAATKRIGFTAIATRLRADPILHTVSSAKADLNAAHLKTNRALDAALTKRRQHLTNQASLLNALSYQATLQRGYALIQTSDGKVLRTATEVEAQPEIEIVMQNNARIRALPQPGSGKTASEPRPKARAKPVPSKDQGDLF